jgi:hypothetical protein
MRRASRGRLEVPGSVREVEGKDALAEDAARVAEVPLESWVFGCVEDWVGGLGLGALEAVVAGGVEMPLARVSAAGDAMLGGCGACAPGMVECCFEAVDGKVAMRAEVD